MRRLKLIDEMPWRQIISDEWKRCKKLRPYMKQNKPLFYWDRNTQLDYHGYYHHRRNSIAISDKYFRYNITNDYFVGVLRHELAHIGTKGHGSDFLAMLERLDGTRYATIKFKELKQNKNDTQDTREN